MKQLITLLIIFFFTTYQAFPQQLNGETYCNPLNISYRFTLDKPSKRIAADPVIVLYKDDYYLFATQSGGYWHSKDLLDWTFITTPDLPFEKDAMGVAVINGSMYYSPMASSNLYKAIDPLAGKWVLETDKFINVGDPDLFQDTDGKVYLYYGCSNDGYIDVVEVDPSNGFQQIGERVHCFTFNYKDHGSERAGDYNTIEENPWLEGPVITKYNSKYYLQFSTPGTQYKSYCDGYYISDNPKGPFTYAPNSPYSAKPEGFINAAGHGGVFQDKYGNWWKIATMSISVKHIFERRLGLFPVTFDADGYMIAHTEFGDLPWIMPNYKYKDVSELFPSWMMLSYNAVVKASSSLDSNPPAYAVNEEIREYWSAKTGDKGEWLSVDLGSKMTVNAIQLNFAENNSELFGRENIPAQQYLLEYSNNNKTWTTLVDKTKNSEDLTHQYHVFSTPINGRYFRVTNYRVPGGTFAISGFRVFGAGNSSKPTQVDKVKITRDVNDERNVSLEWKVQKNATGYNVRFGIKEDKLYRSYQVYDTTSLTIRSLNKGVEYWFAVDAFGKNGITPGVIHKAGTE